MDLGKTTNAQEFFFPGLIGRSSFALKHNLVGTLLIVTTSSAERRKSAVPARRSLD
jgi:hypothetical protein